MLVRKFPVAQALLIQNCKQNDFDQLREIFIQEDDFYKQALLKIKEAYDAKVILLSLIFFKVKIRKKFLILKKNFGVIFK